MFVLFQLVATRLKVIDEVLLGGLFLYFPNRCLGIPSGQG